MNAKGNVPRYLPKNTMGEAGSPGTLNWEGF